MRAARRQFITLVVSPDQTSNATKRVKELITAKGDPDVYSVDKACTEDWC